MSDGVALLLALLAVCLLLYVLWLVTGGPR